MNYCKGTTENRPANLNSSYNGFQYFDTTLDKLIIWNGTEWVDATGNSADTTLWTTIE